jgi:hypothetical protein
MKCPGILMSIGSARLALSTSPVTINYVSTLKLSKFVMRKFLAAIISLTLHSLVYSNCSLVCSICSPKYRNVRHILVLNSLRRKIAGPTTTIIWSIIITTDTKSSSVRIKNARANQEHYLRRGKPL